MVRGKKMKNPLRKRLPRELKTEFGKYLVIFLLLVATIGLMSWQKNMDIHLSIPSMIRQ